MKKLFHLGLMALLVISVSSCSKSADDLLVNEETSTSMDNTARTHPSTGHVSSGPSVMQIPLGEEIPLDDDLNIFPFITEPSLELGIAETPAINGGDFAVFYVTVSSRILSQLIQTAELTVIDQSGWQVAGTYDLISSDEASSYGLKIPEGLNDALYMFAIVNLDDLDSYPGHKFTLASRIITDQLTVMDKMYDAFVYNP